MKDGELISQMEVATHNFELDLIYVAGYDEAWGSVSATVLNGDELLNKTLIDALRVHRLETTPAMQVLQFQAQNLDEVIDPVSRPPLKLKISLEQNTTCDDRAHKWGLRFSLLGCRLKYQISA